MLFTANILHERPKNCNNNRLLQYTPIICSNPILIDEKWYSNLPQWMQKSLLDEFPNAKFECIEIPHIDKYSMSETPEYWKFLGWYKRQYMFDRYESIFPDCYIINLSEKECNELLGM
jgi:hypothetical protein